MNWSLGQMLILRGCEPLPRRRCFAKTIPKVGLHPFPAYLWRNASEKICSWSGLGCKNFACLSKQVMAGEGVRIGSGSGTFAARMAEKNVTVVTVSLTADAPFTEFIASRPSGVFPLYLSSDHSFLLRELDGYTTPEVYLSDVLL